MDALKVCKKCFTLRPPENFGTDRSTADEKKRVCKKCEKERRTGKALVIAARNRLWREANKSRIKQYQAHHYQKNRSLILSRQKEKASATRSRRKERRSNRYGRVALMKKAPCADCGLCFHPDCMEFDHRPGEKKRQSVSWMIARLFSMDVILEEIRKCDLVCSNCHRIRTRLRAGGRGPRKASVDRKMHIVNAIRRRPCSDCHEIYDPVCMDFDHVRGQKLGNISSMVYQTVSVSKLIEEIRKCDLVCSNCHRLRTSIRRKAVSETTFVAEEIR